MNVGGAGENQKKRTTFRRIIFEMFLGVLLPLVLIGAAVYGACELLRTAPKASRRPAERKAVVVEVRQPVKSQEQVSIVAMGTVIPAKEVTLQPQVGGELLEVSEDLVPGGRVEAGQLLVKIDPRDYELALTDARSAVSQAEYEYKLELGHQEIAKHEWELLGDGADASSLDKELALRKPHLVKAEASVSAARAALDQAELNLERTNIRAPFNGIIMDEWVDKGAMVTSQSQIATLVGTDEYWVRVSVPTGQLHWIDFGARSGAGSVSHIRHHPGSGVTGSWSGKVVRLLGDLESEGRMARLLVSVANPLGKPNGETPRSPLLVGSYVEVEVVGERLSDVIRLSRSELRDNNTIWIMGESDKLEIRLVDVVFAGREYVLVRDGIKPGERLIVSELPAPVEGMPLRLRSSSTDSPEVNTAGVNAGGAK